MQEAYIALTQMPDHKLQAFIINCKLPALIYKVIFFKHKNRTRRNSNLEDFNFTDLSDIQQQPSEPAKDLSKSLDILKQQHPGHFEFLNECIEKGMGNDGAKHMKLSRVRNTLKKIYNEQGAD